MLQVAGASGVAVATQVSVPSCPRPRLLRWAARREHLLRRAARCPGRNAPEAARMRRPWTGCFVLERSLPPELARGPRASRTSPGPACQSAQAPGDAGAGAAGRGGQ